MAPGLDDDVDRVLMLFSSRRRRCRLPDGPAKDAVLKISGSKRRSSALLLSAALFVWASALFRVRWFCKACT
tara:strand:- start:148 stop:363 length:216 start_codon:yes stop_codon:yes gene_type:complete